MRPLYPEIEPYQTEFLKVSELHSIYVEQSGNPEGRPVIFLHGGPGGGSSASYRRFFDPKKWRVILFDQRGCGQSTPFAELKENTTWDLVNDIEKIRTHLNIDRWSVFGGSWGSTLALSYAQTHPNVCEALFLRGIFMLRKKEIDWFYQEGASKIYPEAWQKYLAPIPPEERGNLVQAYYKRLTHEDESIRHPAAKAWAVWEGSTSQLQPDPKMAQEFGDVKFAEAFARIECHYFIHGGFFKTDDQLLANIDSIRHIPTLIVHGRYDVVCPVENAFELHQKWPESKLHIIQTAGHKLSEPGITDVLIRATDQFAHYENLEI